MSYSINFTSNSITWVKHNRFRVDGPSVISRVHKFYKKVEKQWWKKGGWHRNDGASTILKFYGLDHGIERVWYYDDELVLPFTFDELEIDFEDMTDEEILIVQMHLGSEQ